MGLKKMEANNPLKKYKVKLTEATVWKNKVQKDNEEIEFLSLNLSKSYKKNEEWKTDSINLNMKEIPQIISMLNKIQDWYFLESKESEQRGE